MSPRRYYWLVGILLTGTAVICAVFGSWRGAAGFVLGTAATAFGLAVWQQIVAILANLAAHEPKPTTGSALIVMAFLVKLPLFVAAVFLAVKIGGAARACFAVGLCEVYSALVGRIFARDAVQSL